MSSKKSHQNQTHPRKKKSNAPRKRNPKIAALRQIAVPGVEGARPFNSGLTQPSAFTSSYSKELYKAGAEFKVPTYDPSAKDGLKYSQTTMEKDGLAKGWIWGLKTEKIPIQDAESVKAAYKVYKTEKTDENFQLLSSRYRAVAELIPTLSKTADSEELNAEDKTGANDVIALYRNDPSFDNYKLLEATHDYIKTQIKKKD